MKFAEAYDTIAEELRKDYQLFYAYQANIAMAFQDECKRAGYNFPDLHAVANDAARNFLHQWIRKSENHGRENASY